MSHSSGIPLSTDLDKAFASARTDGGIRWLKIIIRNDQLVEVARGPLGASFDADFPQVKPLLEPKQPCYIAFRMDTKNINGFEWLLCVYIPDASSVKDRMIFASTREILKRQLGLSYFGDDLFGTSPDDWYRLRGDVLLSVTTYIHPRSFSLEAYRSHKTRTHDAPLTESEQQYRMESKLEIAAGTSKEYVHSVKFPFSPDATAALAGLQRGAVTLVPLLVHPEKETIELAGPAQAGDVSALAASLHADEPRFALFSWPHEDPNTQSRVTSNLFVYWCPPGAKVKLKMLYSTVKSAVVGQAEAAQFRIDKKIEAQTVAEVSAAALTEELHPPQAAKNAGLAAQQMSRPKAQGRPRGAAKK